MVNSSSGDTEPKPQTSARGGARFRRVGRLFRDYRRSMSMYVVLVLSILGLILLLGFVGILDLNFMATEWPRGAPFAVTSLLLTNIAFFAGFACALPLGLIRAYGKGALRRRKNAPVDVLTYRHAKELYGTGGALRAVLGRKLRKAALAPAYGVASGYVEAIRGTPFYVQMFIVFYLILPIFPLFNIFGRNQFFWIGLLALFLNTFGYQSEVLRAGFQSVGQGQIESAKAIGLKGRQIFSHITFPQSIRLVLLPLTNEWISLFKASTLISLISVPELFRWSEDMGQIMGHPIEGFILVSLYYLAINIPLSRGITFIEQKRRIPGLGTQIQEPVRRKKPAQRSARTAT